MEPRVAWSISPLLGWGTCQSAVPFAATDCRWHLLGIPSSSGWTALCFALVRHAWSSLPCRIWGARGLRAPAPRAGFHVVLAPAASPEISWAAGTLCSLISRVSSLWLPGAHAGLFIPAVGGEKGYCQSCKRLWIWLHKTNKQTAWLIIKRFETDIRKSKAIIIVEKNLPAILQQEAPWVLFGSCTWLVCSCSAFAQHKHSTILFPRVPACFLNPCSLASYFRNRLKRRLSQLTLPLWPNNHSDVPKGSKPCGRQLC